MKNALPHAFPHIDVLLFDLGGVLVDIDVQRIYARWAQHAGCDVARVRARARFDSVHERYERGEIGFGAYAAHVRAQLGLDLTDDQILDGWNAIFVGAMPGIEDLLRRAAARFPLYGLSNTNRAHEDYWAKAYAAPLAHLRRMFTSSAIGLRKPDAACFAHVVAEIGVPASRILFFDDLGENVEGARACGLNTVHVASTADIARALERLGA